MRLPNNIKSQTRENNQRIDSLIQSFDIDVQLTRKVWLAIADKKMQENIKDADYYDTPNDVFNDLVVDYGHEKIKGFKIDIGDCCSEQHTNIDYKGCSHDVGYDSDSEIHTCRGLQFFNLMGADIPALSDVDLTKFYQRCQIEEVAIKNIETPRLPTKFMFEDAMEIDSKLLISWIKHQIMLTMFDCIYDPFYMEEAQIQQENQGYSRKEPLYDIPEGFSVSFFNLNIVDTYVDLLK